MPDEQYFDLVFPVSGIDSQSEVGGQRPGTTPTGVNARACDPRTRRLRGGSRSGLSRLIDAVPGGTPSVVQHLAVVAYTSNDGLPDPGDLVWEVLHPPPPVCPGCPRRDPPEPPVPPTITEYPDPWVPDVLNPPRYVPPGGTGVTINPDADPLDPPGGGGGPSGWVFEQSKTRFVNDKSIPAGGGAVEIEITFNSNVQDNQLLVLGIFYTKSGGYQDDVPSFQTAGYASFSVADSLGNTWTEAASEEVSSTYAEDPPFFYDFTVGLKLFYTRTNAGACTVTVTATGTNSGNQVVASTPLLIAAEYTGLENASPFEGAESASSSDSPGAAGPVTVTAGACPVGGNTRLALGLFYFFQYTSSNSGSDVEPAGGFTLRRRDQTISGTSLYFFGLIDDTSTGVASEPAVVTPASVASGEDFAHTTWIAINAAFRFGA